MGSAVGIRERVAVPAEGPGRSRPEQGAVQFDRLAAELASRLPQLASAVLRRVREKHADLDSAAERQAALVSELTRESLRTQLAGFRRAALPERCPEADSRAVEEFAGSVDLRTMLDGYRLCQLTLWQAWFELVEDSLAPEAPERRALLSRGSDYFFRYSELLGGYVAEVYQRQIARPPEGVEQHRLRAIRGLLEEDEGAPPFDFDLERHHLGVLARGDEAKAAIRELAALLERPVLLVAPLSGIYWAWLSGIRPFQLAEQLLESFQQPPGSHLALGQPAYGEAGFRSTHRQAKRAHWASRCSEQGLVLYADVAPESLAGENPEEARRFVERELRGINEDSVESGRMRETLSAYFACDHNAASAAARLGVHQQTVANRLRALEERLGAPVGARRLELELALRLRKCIGEEAL